MPACGPTVASCNVPVMVGERDPVLEEALSKRLAVKRISQAAGISSQAVSRWRRVPERWVQLVADISGIPACELRPDLPQFTKRRRRRWAA